MIDMETAPAPRVAARNGKASLRTRPTRTKSYWPTSKWWAATVTTSVAAAALWIRSGSTKEVALAWLAIGGQAVISYLVPNDPAPGGVPERRRSDVA